MSDKAAPLERSGMADLRDVGSWTLPHARRGRAGRRRGPTSCGVLLPGLSAAPFSGCQPREARLLVFSYPPRKPVQIGLFLSCENFLHAAGQRRAFVHLPAAMIAATEAEGLSVSYRHRGLSWHIVGFERLAQAI